MIAIIRKLFDLLTPRERVHLYLLFAALVGLAFIEMAGIASIMPFMAVVTSPGMVESNRWLKQAYDFFEFSSTQSFLFFLGLVVLGLLVFSNLFKALTAWLLLRYDNRLNYMLARRLLAQYLARPYAFFLNRNTADMGKNVLAEVRTVISGVLSPGMQMLSSILVTLLIFALLLAVEPLVAVTIASVLGGTYALLYLCVRRRLGRIGKEQVMANSMKYKAAGEALCGIKDLKILGRELVFLERFAVHAQRHSRNNVTAGIISLLPKHVLEVLAFGGILMIVLHFLGEERGAGHMVPLLALYTFAAYRLMPAMQTVFASLAAVRFSLASLEVVHRELTEGVGSPDPERLLEIPAGLKPLPFTHELELRNVNFCYSGTQEPVLKGLNLTVPVNTTIGFVGATGSGKTTSVDIILGLLTPFSGQLLADGIEINEHNLVRWQRNLGYVPQNIYLCDDTVTRNIAFGVQESAIEMESVVRAARIANLDDFVTKELPEGYETVIGERGIRLSGGQRQRIGIARALYHDPALLIMDEATSALDGITEEAVMEAIRNLSRKKTIILIAHRLTTVKDCEVIYVLDRGKIIESGKYDDLTISSDWFRAASGACRSVVL